MKTKNYICLFILLFTSLTYSQEQNDTEALVTDRPDATEASSTVGKGNLQIETGGLYESFEDNTIKSENYTYNTTLIRYGILDNMELRLGWDFVEGTTKVNGNKLNNVTSGFSPLLLGVKVDIAEEKGVMPEIALIGHVFPLFSASQDYRPESTAIDFRFSFSHTLSEKSSLGYNLGGEWGNDSPEAAAIYTVAYGYSISDKFGFYAELYGDLPEDSSANHYWDAGFTYLVSNDLQLDAYVGTSITKGQDLLVGIGASYRILKK
ncbi:transporter [Ichthyenterobacterium magnum]|uniref:Outer membrane putative beta-barrel porin/alpha-amylase n=1 Tax=Ichthyenterobacterium magnum TaxID=1230530 RepID=A0A420DXJ2_9FLAO|nr:transporter [Ichthyenterobacterium magnum]RKE98954.1 outer membrane putative beta-barrel porin/alpha-amylase [Ichthyenterobacterium magnum]